ncbi:hypothetical protein DFH07DRAFT_752251 [Mycena maculata]|uniref:Uncharacterized protein n=1 Tax=Mycena maculata TaxID=230809 RepID=A0AAD7N0U0_9AGAR|nr:hypothetical protein DFH07DRAFT_752251 [Mycena maculata]
MNVADAATSALSFAASNWIWTSTVTTGGIVALRKDFTPPLGKALIAAEIIITADDSMGFFVNGEYIGSGTPPARTRFVNRYCVDLDPSFNVFAVNASAGSAGGMLATILITYSDNTTDTLVSDSSWRVHSGLPAGFEQLSFDDTAWPVATSLGAYGAAPWDTVFIPSSPAVLGFARADWVWTDVVPASGTLPAGSRVFRRKFTPAPGQTPMTANIIIAVDNSYTLYVNGTGTDFHIAQHYVVNFATAPSEIVLAVLATNAASGPTAVLVNMEVNTVPSGRVNCTAGSFVLTDDLWLSTKGTIPTGWEQLGFDDSAWPAVISEGEYGVAPWDTVTIEAPAAPVTI